jgi:hypothetical protein
MLKPQNKTDTRIDRLQMLSSRPKEEMCSVSTLNVKAAKQNKTKQRRYSKKKADSTARISRTISQKKSCPGFVRIVSSHKWTEWQL